MLLKHINVQSVACEKEVCVHRKLKALGWGGVNVNFFSIVYVGKPKTHEYEELNIVQLAVSASHNAKYYTCNATEVLYNIEIFTTHKPIHSCGPARTASCCNW